jgi:site-specific DNA-adenine methylase
MRYPGGKGKCYQHVINLIPLHRVYIETHLGGGAVMRHKKPAERNIGIELNARVIGAWRAQSLPHVELVHGRAEDYIQQFAFRGDELVYVDPPYFPSTRRSTRVYANDYSQLDHELLLEILVKLPCKVILSGYANPLYSEFLGHWHRRTFNAKTHVDVRTETLWLNYEPPATLHDARFLGENFRDREVRKRRLQRLQDRLARLDPTERAAVAQWLQDSYPEAAWR